MMKNIKKSVVLLALFSLALVSLIGCSQVSESASASKQQFAVNPYATPTSDTKALSSTKPQTQTSTKTIDKKTVKAKGLYLTASSAGERLQHYIDLANTTEINSYVIDFKDDYGIVCYDSNVPLAKEIGAVEAMYDVEKVIKQLHDNNIYAIARIVCFKDPILAKNKPDMAIKNTNGGLYVHNSMNWVNAYNKDAWQYNIDLAKEALKRGFDEVQFDYIRFPDGRKSEMVFGDTGNQKMYEAINEYLSFARQQLPNAVLSADVFAIICESPGDTEGIGQYFEYVGKDMDYVCPMAYPSHYALGQIINGVKFNKPDFEPYSLIKNTFLKAKARLNKVEGNKPILRAYLQDFTASWIGKGNYQNYGAEQVRQEIQGLYDAGYEEWFLWDPMNTYSEGAFEKE